MAAKWQARLDNLVNAYVNSEFHGYDTFGRFELSLIKLMACFLGHILITFDIYPSECESLCSEDDTVFAGDGKNGDNLGNLTFGCSYGRFFFVRWRFTLWFISEFPLY